MASTIHLAHALASRARGLRYCLQPRTRTKTIPFASPPRFDVNVAQPDSATATIEPLLALSTASTSSTQPRHLSRETMSDAGFEPDVPQEYAHDDDIPFSPKGTGYYRGPFVDVVIGTSGPFKGRQCVRKTIVHPSTSNETLAKRLLTRETRALQNSRHTHVVQLVHSYFDNRMGGMDGIIFCIVMDYADTNLGSYLDLESSTTKVPSQSWFGCLLDAVRHIHSLGIRHRDIKPSNILIKSNQVLLADFGISQMGLGKTMPTTSLGRNAAKSSNYCAPEVDQGRTRGRSADIFSLGAVFLEMCAVHSGQPRAQSLAKIVRSQAPGSYAKTIDLVHEWIEAFELAVDHETWQGEILRLCKRMLQRDRDQRPTALSLKLGHPLLVCKCANDVPITPESLLLVACKSGSVDLVSQTLLDGANPRLMGAIHLAAEKGSAPIVEMLLHKGTDVDALNQTDQTPLHCASRSGCEDVVKLLLANNSSVNAQDENKQTPLHGAAAHGYDAIVRMLLWAGADTRAKNSAFKRPYTLAKGRGYASVLQILDDYRKMAHGELH